MIPVLLKNPLRMIYHHVQPSSLTKVVSHGRYFVFLGHLRRCLVFGVVVYMFVDCFSWLADGS